MKNGRVNRVNQNHNRRRSGHRAGEFPAGLQKQRQNDEKQKRRQNRPKYAVRKSDYFLNIRCFAIKPNYRQH